MRSMSVCLAALSICAAGCNPPPATHYTMFIDPNLPNEYVVATYNAVYAWENILDGKLSIDIVGGYNPDAEEPDTIYVHASSHDAMVALGASEANIGYTIWRSWKNEADVYVPVVQDLHDAPASLERIMAHEIGHSFELHHVQGYHIMNPDFGGASPLPSCGDAAQWFFIRTDYQWPRWLGNRSCPDGGTFTLSGS
jgi:hypothetical protein